MIGRQNGESPLLKAFDGQRDSGKYQIPMILCRARWLIKIAVLSDGQYDYANAYYSIISSILSVRWLSSCFLKYLFKYELCAHTYYNN